MILIFIGFLRGGRRRHIRFRPVRWSVRACAYVSAGGLSDRFAVEFSSLTSNIGPVNNDYNL